MTRRPETTWPAASLFLLAILGCGVLLLPLDAAAAPRAPRPPKSAKAAPLLPPSPAASDGKVDGYEPDDTYGQATPIATDGTPQTHDIDPASDTDYVKFTVPAGTMAIVETSATGSGDVEDTELWIWSTNGTTQLAYDDDGGDGYYSKAMAYCASAGTYYASVESYWSSYTGNYKIAVSVVPVSPDSYEPDNDAAHAKPIATNGGLQQRSICPAGDKDYASFQAQAGKQYVLETHHINDQPGDTYMYLYDTDGTTVIQEDDDSGADVLCSKIEWTCPSAGTYYAAVEHYSTSGICNYALNVTASETITGNVTDGTNPIENVGIWVVDVNKAFDTADAIATTDASGNYTCIVPAGTYTVSAHLANHTATPTSREITVPGGGPANFVLSNTGPPAGDGVETCRAVLVGISDYVGTLNDLDFCDDDATEFGQALASGGNWQDTNIEVIVDRQATAANIWAALQRMATNADADDLCIFFFSGHGTTGTDLAPIDEGGGDDEYICETNLTSNIRDDELADWIATLPTQKTMCVICSCFSGGFIKTATLTGKGLGRGDPAGTPRNGFAEDLRRAMAWKAAQQPKDLDDLGQGTVLTAADDTETCAESATLQHDIFAYYILEGMGAFGSGVPADTNSDHWVSAEEAHAYAYPKALAQNPGQHAQLYDANPATAFRYFNSQAGPPVLAWLGSGGYASDGVDPDRGNILDWYTFKVKYTGAPPTHVRLHLFRYGVEVAGSPMDMNAGTGNPATGQTFWFKRRLCKGTYSYYFRASDGTSSATGDPTLETVGPIVYNRPPRLEWRGAGAWTSDPVDPQGRQLPGTEFTWKIKYIDREGDPPQYVRLHLARRTMVGGNPVDTELAQSPFTMTPAQAGYGPQDYMNGAVFKFTKTLNCEARYVCWFEAKESAPAPFTSQEAYGVPTWWHRGGVWVFDVPPRLMWAPGPNFRGDSPPDGLHPNTGNVGDTFTFKVQYRDPEGTQPDYVRLHLLKWNGSDYVEVGASPYAMSTTDTTFDIANYSVNVQRNNPGRFRYYFSASDGDKDAIGEPSWHRMPGPIVNATQSAAAQVSVLTCCVTPSGVQATFTLSADAAVTAEVLNIAGRPVKTLMTAKPMAAGTRTLLWNGCSDGGLAVPSGVYLVRVNASDEKGAQSQALGTVMITR